MKKPCAYTQCGKYRSHWERPDEERGTQYIEVPDDYEGLVYCSITCAVLAGVLKLKQDEKE